MFIALDECKSHLIANVNLNPRLEVVKDLFKVSCPGSSQVTCITVRLDRKREGRGNRDEVWPPDSNEHHIFCCAGRQEIKGIKHTYKWSNFTVPGRSQSYFLQTSPNHLSSGWNKGRLPLVPLSENSEAPWETEQLPVPSQHPPHPKGPPAKTIPEVGETVWSPQLPQKSVSTRGGCSALCSTSR